MKFTFQVKEIVGNFQGGGFDKEMLRKRIEIALFFKIEDRKKRKKISEMILEKLEKGDYEIISWQ